MKISVSGSLPPSSELVSVLNDAFAPRYSFRVFGIGAEKTIMAQKSFLVGLQVSVTDNQIHFQRTAPTIASSLFSFMMLTELVVLLILPLLIIFEGFKRDPYKEMAKEIGFFLKKAYPPQQS